MVACLMHNHAILRKIILIFFGVESISNEMWQASRKPASKVRGLLQGHFGFIRSTDIHADHDHGIFSADFLQCAHGLTHHKHFTVFGLLA